MYYVRSMPGDYFMPKCMHSHTTPTKQIDPLQFLVSTDTHHRCGIYAVTALIFAAIVAFMGFCIYRLTKNGAAGWIFFLCLFVFLAVNTN